MPAGCIYRPCRCDSDRLHPCPSPGTSPYDNYAESHASSVARKDQSMKPQLAAVLLTVIMVLVCLPDAFIGRVDAIRTGSIPAPLPVLRPMTTMLSRTQVVLQGRISP